MPERVGGKREYLLQLGFWFTTTRTTTEELPSIKMITYDSFSPQEMQPQRDDHIKEFLSQMLHLWVRRKIRNTNKKCTRQKMPDKRLQTKYKWEINDGSTT